MHRLATSALALVLATAPASAEDIILRGMGSFHVGGRTVEINGKPVRDIVRVPAALRPSSIRTGSIRSSRCMRNIFFPRTAKARCHS